MVEFPTDVVLKNENMDRRLFVEVTKNITENRSVNVSELCRRFGCEPADVMRVRNKVIKSLDKADVEYVSNKFKLEFDKLQDIAAEMLDYSRDSGDRADMRESMNMSMKVITEYTNYLERFHLKAKAVENLAVVERPRDIVVKMPETKDVEATVLSPEKISVEIVPESEVVYKDD